MADKKKKSAKPEAEQTEEIKEEAKAEEAEEKEEVKAEDETEKLQKQLDAVNDRLLRTLAEYDNFRKRTQKEKEAIYSDSKADIITKLLPVLDNFERAAANTQTDFDGYKKGIEMTVGQLLEIIKNLGVESFGEAGQEFDPNFHNGVMHVEDESLAENVIADVFMKGYKMGDRVLRPATVKVAN